MSATRTGQAPGGVGSGEAAERPLAWPGDPGTVTAAGIDFEALAHVLANTCRFGGRTRRFWSVAQRAVAMSEEIAALDGPDADERRRLALHALLADVRVAWLGDARSGDRTSERAADRSRRLGAAIDRAVREAAGIDSALTVEQADLLRFVARMTDAAERRDLADAATGGEAGAARAAGAANAASAAGLAFPPLKTRLRPAGPGRAARLWLARFRELAAPPSGASDTGGASGTGGANGTSGASAAGTSGAESNPTADEKENGDVAHLEKTQEPSTAHGTERGDDRQPLAA